MNTIVVRIRQVVLASAVALAATVPLVANGPAPTKAQSEYEVRFMTEMIDHHFMAIMMADTCVDNAVHEELRTLCTNIIATQTQEINTMQSWLQSWYGVTHAPEMTSGDQNRMEKMAAAAGSEFEIMFLKSMIRHHWKAIVRAAGCIDRAYHDELIEMCADIVEAQTAEIVQMRTWLCDWYGICNYGPKGDVAEIR